MNYEKVNGRGVCWLRQVSELLDQSYYVRQLGCAVGGVLVLIAKSEWGGGDQKKMEKMEFDMPTSSWVKRRLWAKLYERN